MPLVASHIYHTGTITVGVPKVVSTNSIRVHSILFSNGFGFNATYTLIDNDGVTILRLRVPAFQSRVIKSVWLATNGLSFSFPSGTTESTITGTVIYSEEG